MLLDNVSLHKILPNIPNLLRLYFILVSGTCNYRWIYYNGSCYYFSARYTKVDYHNAKTYCNRMGAQLVSIRNAAENEFVKNQLRR